MKLKNLTIILLLIACTPIYAQQKSISKESLDSVTGSVAKMINYFLSYDDPKQTEANRKEKFDEGIDAVYENNLSESNKDEAFKIVNWYIKADKAGEKQSSSNSQTSLEKKIKQTDEYKKAEDAMNTAISKFQNMSYEEFETIILSTNPTYSKREIKEAYNKLHQNDGKQVSISSSSDDEMTDAQKQIWAAEVMNNPKNCEEFKKAFRILKPNVTESELSEACNKLKL